jgi:hypothetical protein
MKITFLLVLSVILVKSIQSKKPIRTYVVGRKAMISGNPLPGYKVYDPKETRVLYQLKPMSSDVDTIILVDDQKKNIVGNLEGEWTSQWPLEDKFNITFSIYDYNLNKWIDGTIKRDRGFFNQKLQIQWNEFRLVAKKSDFSYTTKLYDERGNDLLSQFRWQSVWSTSATKPKYNLKIFSDKVPDAISFFILAIVDQREVILGEDA